MTILTESDKRKAEECLELHDNVDKQTVFNLLERWAREKQYRSYWVYHHTHAIAAQLQIGVNPNDVN